MVRRHAKMSCAGFTLIELLVVIAILGLLLAVLLPAVNYARESSRRLSCANNLKQIGLALKDYESAYEYLPSGYVTHVDQDGNETGPGWGWAVLTLPYIDQQPLFDKINLNAPIDGASMQTLRTHYLPSFVCPSDSAERVWDVSVHDKVGNVVETICEIASANYVGVFGVTEPGIDGEGLFFRNSRIRPRDIKDGASNTLMVGERSSLWCPATWVGAVSRATLFPPPDSPTMPFVQNSSGMVLAHTFEGLPNTEGIECNNFSSEHSSGASFVFADGHTMFITDDTDLLAYRAMSTRAGGEKIEGESL